MKIAIFGTGYVGLVTGVAFAEMGNDVICVDVDPRKVEKLKAGVSPIYEPGLEELLAANIAAKRIEFTSDEKMAMQDAEVVFIAVGTPPQEDGSADLSYVLQVAETIAENISNYVVVVNKSTVPVGTFHRVKDKISEVLKRRQMNADFDVCSNPEFLREGAAIEDCLKPSRVVIGVETERAASVMQMLYEPFLKNGNPLFVMNPTSSEMTKYAANSMLAAKVSLMNEFSRICEEVGADIELVRRGIAADPRIGPHFIYAGVGYGGSCFPKDVQALVRKAEALGLEPEILKAVESVNKSQRERFYKKIQDRFSGSLAGKTIALWGIAFKPGTDDIREAPSIYLIEKMLAAGAKVKAFDPVAAEVARAYFDNSPSLEFVGDQYDVLTGADVLVIVTEWKSFREPDFSRMKKLMKSPVIFDGRNIYTPQRMKGLEIEYHSVGRPS